MAKPGRKEENPEIRKKKKGVKCEKKKYEQVGELRRQKLTPILLMQTIKEIKEKDYKNFKVHGN